jgi:glutathione S-transferase/RNA polymerase-associated protein
MALRLFDHPLSPYSQKVKIALREKGVAFEARLPTGLGSGAQNDGLGAASPRGEVPALVLETGEALFESTVLLEFIEERWPEPPLAPSTPLGRARARMIEEAMDTHYEAINWALGEIHHFGRSDGALRDQLLAGAEADLTRWYAWLEAQLGDAPWFGGEGFGWADAAVLPHLLGSEAFGLGPAPERPLGAYLARGRERPSVQAGREEIAALGTGGASLEAVRAALEAGLFKREYRDHRLEWMMRHGGLAVVQEGLDRGNIRFTEPFSAEGILPGALP